MINRHNYEEYFLLYADAELTPDQRKAVELFVQDNPDLKQELEILQQTVLSIDNEAMLMDKSGLYKTGETITMDNYESYFLLYIDNELDAKSKAEVETFVLQHPALQVNFTLLRELVLPAEIIEFTGKDSLYKKEERRVIPIGWMRLAVAAAIAGLAIVIWWMVPGTTDIAPANVVALTPANNLKQQQPVASTKSPAITAPVEVPKTAVANIITKPVEQRKQPIPIQTNNDKTVAQTNNDNNLLPQTNNGVKEVNVETYIPTIAKEETNVLPVPANTQEQVLAAVTQPAAYRELNTNDDNDASLYVGNLNINKNKLRGVIKKVGGIFAGKNKSAVAANEQGKLQVANFEINKN
ncbi:anti-sigma factor family protein [Limnovirga soli]|uniref:Uncharacterized protein n=1 Tax=Limnovirga soli TaxID=2656915 RepID=A0A8J8FKN6_9BACT|nr:hypothetical protein [Limnovirga soli]NNV56784.1 hypothetical protein [Limnovirga soli]